MALRDAIHDPPDAARFVDGLTEWLHGDAPAPERFRSWIAVIGALPRRKTRVLTWPVATVWGFLADPRSHLILKPNVTRRAADAYGYPFGYKSAPNWATYASLLDFARLIRKDLHDLRPRDMIDIQSFLWVQGSDEYE